MARFILDIKEEMGISIMMIEHNMEVVMDIADQICVINFGTKSLKETLRNSERSESYQAYLGED